MRPVTKRMKAAAGAAALLWWCVNPCSGLRMSTEGAACEPQRRRAAYRAMSSLVGKHDTMAPRLAGESFVDAVRDELQERGELEGMRGAYNTLESPCVIGHWLTVSMHQFLELRPHVRQVVIMRAGLDTRAYHVRCLAARQVFEVDEPGVMYFKNSMLQSSAPRPAVTAVMRVACAVREDDAVLKDHWLRALRQAGWSSSAPSVWLLEGVADEWRLRTTEHLLRTIHGTFATGGLVLLDTRRMTEDRGRLRTWLHDMELNDHDIDALRDPGVHGGLLHPSDPGFHDAWLVRCRT